MGSWLTRNLSDNDWLQLLNAERKKDQLDSITPEVFEVIMDQLEKEWFILVRRPPVVLVIKPR